MSDEINDEWLNEFIESRAINDETMAQLELNASDSERGQQRELIFLAMARSVMELSDYAIDDPEGFKDWREAVADFKTHTETLLEMSKKASIRLSLAHVATFKNKAELIRAISASTN